VDGRVAQSAPRCASPGSKLISWYVAEAAVPRSNWRYSLEMRVRAGLVSLLPSCEQSWSTEWVVSPLAARAGQETVLSASNVPVLVPALHTFIMNSKLVASDIVSTVEALDVAAGR
jgi:hypothetical protein